MGVEEASEPFLLWTMTAAAAAATSFSLSLLEGWCETLRESRQEEGTHLLPPLPLSQLSLAPCIAWLQQDRSGSRASPSLREPETPVAVTVAGGAEEGWEWKRGDVPLSIEGKEQSRILT